MSRRMRLPIYKLIEAKKYVKTLRWKNQIARFVEQRFDVNVDDVLIRPLGHAFSAQVLTLSQGMRYSELYSK
jgi:hypothetical protein